MQTKTNPIVLFIKESWLLLVAAFCFGLLLAGINAAWSPKIEANKIKKINDAIGELIPTANNPELMIDDEEIKFSEKDSAKLKLYKVPNESGELTGWAFTATGPGYADKIDLMIAVDPSFNEILGYKVLFSNETTGFGDKIKTPYYKDQFDGAPAKHLELLKLGDAKVIDDKIVAISGATISSNAVVDIFDKYLKTVKELMIQKGLLK